MIKLLAIGDITTPDTVSYIAEHLWAYRKQNNIDFVIANAENAEFLSGISPSGAEVLLAGGVDCLTGGNHTMQNRRIYPMLESSSAVLRPLNYPDLAPGAGYTIMDCGLARILVMNALGCVDIEPRLDHPYPKILRILDREAGRYDLSVLDIHAEATGEKITLAHALDGRISAIFGTHTHVPTADECVLPLGTGYISDIGMSGHSGGILGVKPEVMIDRMKTGLRSPYQPAEGPLFAEGVIFALDEHSGRACSVSRVTLFDAIT